MKTSKILFASLIAAAAMSTGTHAATLADAVLSIDAFNKTAVENLTDAGWTISNITGTDTGVFTSTETQATIAAGTSGKTFTTSSGGRNTYSVVFTVNKSAFEALTSGSYNDGILVSGKTSSDNYTGNVGAGLKSGNITGAWVGGSWETLKIANATNYADANDLITIGFVYNSGDKGSTLYVLNTDGTTTTTASAEGLRGGGNIVTAVLSDLSGVSYSNLYWFNTALSATDMTSAMTTVGSGYVWAGTSSDNVWNTTSTNNNWLKDSEKVAFTSGSSVIFGNAAESKSVVIDSAITAADVSVMTDYSFTINEGGSLTADSIGVSSGATLDISGAGTLAGALTKAGAGTLTLSGANTYSGKTTISAGTLVVKNESALGTGNISISAGGELKLDIGSSATMTQGAGTISGDYSTNAKLTIASGKLVLTSASNEFRGTVDILNGGILELNSGAKLLKTYSNSFVWIRSGGELRMTSFAYDALGASPDYAQYRQIDGGRISITGDTSTSGQGFTVTENGGEFLMEKSGQTLTLNGNANSNIIVLNGALKIGGAGDIVINKNASKVAIAGKGSLEKVGDGTLTINSSGNTYEGGTTVTQGKLIVGSSDALGTGPVSVETNGKLQLGTDAVSIGTLSGAGTIGLASGTTSSTLTVNQSADGEFSGTLSGAVSLTKSGTGTLKLSGDNSAFTGGVTLSAGTLELGHNNALGDATSTLEVTGSSTLTLGSGLNVANTIASHGGGLTLTLNSAGDAELSGVLAAYYSGTTEVKKTGAGTLTLSGDNSAFMHGTISVEAGTLLAKSANALGTVTTATDNAVRLSGGTLKVGSGVTLAQTNIEIALSDAYETSAAITGEDSTAKLAEGTKISIISIDGGADIAVAAIAVSTVSSQYNYTIADTILGGSLKLSDFELSSDLQDEGWKIAAYSSDSGVLTLTMVPEPSTFGLLAGVGALALVVARRRHRAK